MRVQITLLPPNQTQLSQGDFTQVEQLDELHKSLEQKEKDWQERMRKREEAFQKEERERAERARNNDQIHKTNKK